MSLYAKIIDGLTTMKVLHWGADSDNMSTDESRVRAPLRDSDIVTSLVKDQIFSKHHKPLLDIDHDALLVPSSTPGHSHLYVDVEIPEAAYWPLIEALATAGVIEPGYASVSKERGHTDLRLPWVKK